MKKSVIGYEKNTHQILFHNDTTSKYLTLTGGFGSGKSYALTMKAFQLSQLNRGLDGGCVVPSIAEYKKDLLPIFEAVLDQNRIKYKYHKTDKWFKFPWSSGKLYIATAERPIRGPNWSYCVINEVSLISHASYKEAIGRVRIKNARCPQIASGGTPEGIGHWLYETFVEKPGPNSKIIYGDTRDNQANLSSDYIQSLMDSYDSVMLDAYLRGMFINMSSNRFYYSYDPKLHLSTDIKRIDGASISVSMDFNVDPMAATLWNVVPMLDIYGSSLYTLDGMPMKKAIAFDQIEIYGGDTNRMCDALYARNCTPDNTIIYPDPAGNQRSTKGLPDIQILKNRGFHQIKVKSVAPQFRKRQLAVNNLFDKNLIQINPITCPGLKKDCEAVTQDMATYGKMKDNPKLTHFSDGMDYFLDIEFPLSGSKPKSTPIRIR